MTNQVNYFLVIDPSHPDIVLVDADTWPKEPKRCGPKKKCSEFGTCYCLATEKGHNRLKSEALKQGAVVEWRTLPTLFLSQLMKTASSTIEYEDLKAGAYPLDLDKWQVEIKHQCKDNSKWEGCAEWVYLGRKEKGLEVREIAIISSVEQKHTPVGDTMQDQMMTMLDQMGLNPVKINHSYIDTFVSFLITDPMSSNHDKNYIKENLKGHLIEVIKKDGNIAHGIIAALETYLKK